MKDISSFLQRFARSLGKDDRYKDVVISCVKEVVGFDIPKEDISLKDGTLVLSASSAVKKNAIRMNEDRILSEVSARCGINVRRVLYK